MKYRGKHRSRGVASLWFDNNPRWDKLNSRKLLSHDEPKRIARYN